MHPFQFLLRIQEHVTLSTSSTHLAQAFHANIPVDFIAAHQTRVFLPLVHPRQANRHPSIYLFSRSPCLLRAAG